MEQIQINRMGVVIVLGFLWLLPSVGEAGTKKLTCGATKTIQKALTSLKPGDTLLVSGTCSENVVVNESHERITIDGQTTATINGPDANRVTLSIRGRGITIKGFTITGGLTGIQVLRGGTALIDGNTVQNTGGTGIAVNQHSFARIINNTIQNNSNGNGISVSESSSARIGFSSNQDTSASPNTIQNNSLDGIGVTRSSSARIIGNTISNNGDDGIRVTRNSSADIASNTINGNASDGISVRGSSIANLGNDTGTTIFDLSNHTTANNGSGPDGGFGVRCTLNASVDGRLAVEGEGGAAVTDPLNGVTGQKSISGGCVDGLDAF